MRRALLKFAILCLAWLGFGAQGADLATLIANRAAVERVYHSHRLGNKQSFEEALPPALLEKLVRQDLKKEAVLKRVYGVEISPAQLDAEVRRIDTTTRAPEVLAELKAALGGDAARFAATVARPILVERELRRRFENDDTLHAQERKQMEQTRAELLSAKQSGADGEALIAILKRGKGSPQEMTWLLTPHPVAKVKPDEIEIKKKFGENAQILSSPEAADAKLYFEDLQPELRNVLKVQLRQPGDISAVIETPNTFLLYVAREMNQNSLSATALVLPKRGYEAWLEEQP